MGIEKQCRYISIGVAMQWCGKSGQNTCPAAQRGSTTTANICGSLRCTRRLIARWVMPPASSAPCGRTRSATAATTQPNGSHSPIDQLMACGDSDDACSVSRFGALNASGAAAEWSCGMTHSVIRSGSSDQWLWMIRKIERFSTKMCSKKWEKNREA